MKLVEFTLATSGPVMVNPNHVTSLDVPAEGQTSIYLADSMTFDVVGDIKTVKLMLEASGSQLTETLAQ